MAEIKRILQIKELNRDFSNRQIGKIVNCSKDTVKVILSLADTLSITYEKIKDLNEEGMVLPICCCDRGKSNQRDVHF